MKFVSFRRNGASSYGVAAEGRVRDIGRVLGAQYPDLKSLLSADWKTLATEAAREAETLDLGGLELLPPIPNPSKIFCIGHNYEEHRVETGRPKTASPAVFTRFADTQVGHGGAAWVPASSVEIDFEGEMAVVIGREGRRIARADALSYVAGYSCYNDISVRDWQRHTSQFTPGKNFPHTGGFGPWLVTTDEIPNPQELDLTTRLNGRVVQHASTNQMIFPVDEIIEYLSAFTRLYPGDVIASGTPGGVGVRRTPQLFMKAGDVVEVEISSIGLLRLDLADEPA